MFPPSVQDARDMWAEASRIPDAELGELLDAAAEQCAAYAPNHGFDLPRSLFSRACVMQARELWQAALREGDVIGVDQYVVRSRPLTGTVRSLLRPKRGVPTVG